MTRAVTRPAIQTAAFHTYISLFFIFFTVLFSSTAYAAKLEFTVTQTQVGGITGLLNVVGDDYCPTASSPGCDFSSTDSVVRTNDDIEFQFNVSVGPAGDGPVILTTALDPGLIWPTLPSSCNAATSSITGDGTAGNPSILSCDLGTQKAWASSFNVAARAMGSNPNGTEAGIASGSVDAPNSTKFELLFKDIPADVKITASPRMNLRKQYRTQGPVKIGGVTFLRVQYTWWIETWKHDINGNTSDDPDPKLGNEMIVGPVTFIEDPSTVSPNAYLEVCNRVGASTYPYDTYNATFPQRSVLNAGTVSCSNTGPTATGPVTVTVTGADFSLTHTPTETRSGASITSDRAIASFGTFYILVPVTDIDDAGGDLASVNTVTGFDPVSISGISNLDEDESDNIVARNLIAGKGLWSKLFRHSMVYENDPGRTWYSPPTTATANWAGDGLVQRGQTFATSTTFNNNSFDSVDEVEICDVIDTSLYEFADVNATPGKAHYVYGPAMNSGGEGTGYLVEYGINYVGIWPPASYPNPAALNTECTDASVQWFTSLTAARAAGTPTKIRYSRLTPQPIGSGGFVIKHRVRSDITDPNGTLLTNMASYRSTLSKMEWRDCAFNAGAFPTPTLVSNYCGDRLALTQSLARVVKTTVPNDLIDVVQAGGTVRYKLAPNYTSVNVISDNIKVVDKLPIGVSYATNSAVWGGVPTAPTVTGTPATGQILTWDLGTWVANTPIPSIEFDAQVPLTASNGTVLDNKATIIAVTDGSSEAQRSDVRRITASSPASLLVAKTTDTPLENQDTLFRFKVEYFNSTPDDIATVDLIDILPYDGDNRTPSSSFSGSYVISPLTFDTSNGTAYYTSLLPQSAIVNDPQDASNALSGGSTKWCTAAQFGTTGCPAGFAQVTALRLVDLAVLPSRDSRSMTIELTPSGNFGGELYTNIVQASGQGITLSPYSPYATTRVIEKSEIGLAKSLSAQNDLNFTFSFVVENLGNTHLSSVRLLDDMDATFGAGNYTVTGLPTVTVQPAAGNLTANAAYTGTGVNTNLLDPAAVNLLPVGTTATVTVTIGLTTQADMGNGLGVYENSATVEGTTSTGNTTNDISDDGVVTDSNNDGDASDADENDPTPFIMLPFDRGDAPLDGSVAPSGSGVTSYGRAIHTIVPGIQLGANIDIDHSSIANANATGDGSDDDAVASLPTLSIQDRTYAVDVETTNQLGKVARLIAWIDFDGNGSFDADEVAVRSVPDGTVGSVVTLTWSNIPPDIQLGNSFMRVRLSSESMNNLEPYSMKSDGEVEDYAIAIVSAGVTVGGRVYVDINSNATEEAGEAGIGSTVVVLYDSVNNICRSVTTNGDGDYSFSGVPDGGYELYQAHGETTPIPQSCGSASANNPTGYQSTTPDLLPITVAGADVIDQDFGEVAGTNSSTTGNSGAGIRFEPDHQSEVLPGNVVFYAHTFSTEADGVVRFTTTDGGNTTPGWTHTLYRDVNCNGTLDGTEGNTPIMGINLGVSAGGKHCIIDKVFAPANAPQQDQYVVETTASFTFAGGAAVPIELKVTDITTTGQQATATTSASPEEGASRLTLRKSVENLTQGTAETESSNQAEPGDRLKYRIYYRNTGTGPITDLEVNDSVPVHTVFVVGSESCDISPVGLSCTANRSLDALDWNFTGSLPGGAAGNVSYEVMVNN